MARPEVDNLALIIRSNGLVLALTRCGVSNLCGRMALFRAPWTILLDAPLTAVTVAASGMACVYLGWHGWVPVCTLVCTSLDPV